MLAPLSWLKEYVDIALTPKKLAEKLTEVGLSVEKITKTPDDTILELEITPNRPDLLSIVGIAREIAAIEGKKVKYPGVNGKHPEGAIGGLKPEKILPLKIQTNVTINPRFTGIIINNIIVKESPNWLKDRLKKIGQRSVNNIVDITNYVMFELGNPIHAFDYDKIAGQVMTVHQTKGGELFKSVDAVLYRLPKNAVVISDKEEIIDLCGIKGGENSGTYKDTKTIFIRVPVEIPSLIRRTSMSLGLRSVASSIFERGVNKGGTLEALKRCIDLIREIAGGEVTSELYDIKSKDFKPWKLNLRIEKLNHILGIEIPEKRVLSILESLNLNPALKPHLRGVASQHLGGGRLKAMTPPRWTSKEIECTIPTYRNDLKIEEDLIEEVARLYGYNNFPKTMPTGETPTNQIPYFRNFKIDEKVKNILTASGFSEIYTHSLVSEDDLKNINVKSENCVRVDNPVSREFEYLRPTLKINLLKALKLNKPNFKNINLFELGKVYAGKNLDEAREYYVISGITNVKNFFEVKGIIEKIFDELGVKLDSTKHIEVLDEGVFFEFNFSEILPHINLNKKFKPLPKYPPIIEDLAIVVRENVRTDQILDAIKRESPLISSVSLLDSFESSRTFHIVYRDPQKNLTTDEVSKIRSKILKTLKEKLSAMLKE